MLTSETIDQKFKDFLQLMRGRSYAINLRIYQEIFDQAKRAVDLQECVDQCDPQIRLLNAQVETLRAEAENRIQLGEPERVSYFSNRIDITDRCIPTGDPLLEQAQNLATNICVKSIQQILKEDPHRIIRLNTHFGESWTRVIADFGFCHPHRDVEKDARR